MAEFYNASENEKKINDDWKKKKTWEKALKKNKGKEKFYFLDGPPFVTNEVHQGTMYTIFIKFSHRTLNNAYIYIYFYRFLLVGLIVS